MPASDRFSTLDGLRGFSAVIIAMHHFWPQAAPSAFFSLDLFFALSGFVLVQIYEPRFGRDMGVIEFVARRAIRFLPLYWVGLAFGLGLELEMALRHQDVHMPLGRSIAALIPNLAMLPSPFSLVLYPFNLPSWSLWCEFVVNVAMVLWLWRLPTRTLVWLAAAAGVVMVALVIQHDMVLPPAEPGDIPRSGFNAGATWEGFHVGLARATYSFIVGMIMARQLTQRPRPRSWVAVLAWVILLSLQSTPVAQHERLAFDLASGLIAPPLLLWMGTRFESPRWFQGSARWFGDVSFGLYMVHLPLTHIFGGLAMRLHASPVSLIPAYLAVAVLGGWLATMLIDVPMRQRLTGAWRRVRQKPRAAN